MKRRRIIKTMTWRVIATSITISVSYIITGSLGIAGTVGAIDAAIKMMGYYAHENIWDRIQV
jgi:adenylylsulfate kinase